jgi:hypothetical protein
MSPIVCFIPCCRSKKATGQIIGHEMDLSEKELPITWRLLEKGRQEIRGLNARVYFDADSPVTSALYLYTGAFYGELCKRSLVSAIQEGKLRLFILSAGYGVVDAFEPLRYYDAEMKGQVAGLWRGNRLDEVISELLLTLRPKNVFGFFAGEDSWAGAGAKYRYFFTKGLDNAMNEGLDVGLSGCFYRSAGLGTTAILGSLGRLFMYLFRSDFNPTFISGIEAKGRADSTTVLSFKQTIL